MPFQFGSFLVFPQIDIARAYDDNIYSTRGETVGDRLWVVSPALRVQSNWARHALNLHAGWDITRYDRHAREDTNDRRVSAEGRYDISASANVYGGVLLSKDHEDRESPSDRNGLTPTEYSQQRVYAGFFRQFDRVSLRVAGTLHALDYRDVDFIGGGGSVQQINNDDRDRRQQTGGVRVGYEIRPGLEPYLLLAFDNRRYDDPVDDLGYRRDSNGSRYLAGIRWNMPRQVRLDAFAGYLRQRYEDSRLHAVSAPLAGASLQWQVSGRTNVSARLDRSVEETTVTQTPAPGVVLVSSSYLNTQASASIEHRPADKWSIRLNAAMSRVAYQGIDRDDTYRSVGIGIAFRPAKNLIADLDVAARRMTSNNPNEGFSRGTVFLRLIVPFSH